MCTMRKGVVEKGGYQRKYERAPNRYVYDEEELLRSDHVEMRRSRFRETKEEYDSRSA
jgi:hypothetical protein